MQKMEIQILFVVCWKGLPTHQHTKSLCTENHNKNMMSVKYFSENMRMYEKSLLLSHPILNAFIIHLNYVECIRNYGFYYFYYHVTLLEHFFFQNRPDNIRLQNLK
jgi:hypothetical protein